MLFKRIILILAVVLPASGIAQRQDKLFLKAQEAYQYGRYPEALELTERVIRLDPGHQGACLLMADIYHDMKDPVKETGWLEKAAGFSEVSDLVRYRLGDVYFKTGRYQKAFEVLQGVEGKNFTVGIREKLGILKRNSAFASEAVKHPVSFKPERLSLMVNSPYDEYWPGLTLDDSTLVFTRLVPVGGNPGLKQEDFFSSSLDTSGWRAAVPLPGLNSALNEGAQCISADGKLVFFTLCNHPAGFGSCDIWFSRLEEGKWSPPRNAGEPVNTPGWEGQPSLSAFGDYLYFSSSRPGGKGGKDIWRIRINGWEVSGVPAWGELTNLGDSINTPGEEISPFIHPNGNDLYFSSDFWPGFGGLDLFHSKCTNGVWSKAENLGYPVNTPGNEQGLIIDRTGMTAYFASGLSQGGNMDIFSFRTDDTFRPAPVTYVRGKVTNALTGAPVPALVEISGNNPSQPLEIEYRAGKTGIFMITLPQDQDVTFRVNEKGFLFYSEQFRFTDRSTATEPVRRQISLIPAEPGRSIDLYNIFYATNAFTLLPESEPELKTLVKFLKENPGLSVEIGGHTDNVGTAGYNLELSGKRAASVSEYLTGNGIAPGRLTSKGYGKDFPVASNETEEGRSKNRRTTIKITESGKGNQP